MTLEQFKQSSAKIGYKLSEAQVNAFVKYMRLLKEENKKVNLTAINEDNEILRKHFYDSILLAPYLDINKSLLDIGSGAGFPGIPLAIIRPDLKITLLEPTKKRVRFLLLVKERLNLDNIEVVNDRAEDYAKVAREMFYYTTARAVANMQILAELALPLTSVNGTFLAMKGSDIYEEVNAAKKAITLLGGVLSKIDEYSLYNGDMRSIVKVNKIKQTPINYPRLYSQIKKRPL